MTQQEIMDTLRRGNVESLYFDGLLDVCDLRMAVDNGWLPLEDAMSWYEVLMDI